MEGTSGQERTEHPSSLDSDDGDELQDHALFQEPEGYFQSEKPPSFAEHTLLSGTKLRLRLVGHSPLWGHLLWNAGHVVSEYLQRHAKTIVRGKDVLELGAGAGLPGLVVITDYPDQDLIDNLKYNINCTALHNRSSSVLAEGYLWGAPVSTSMSGGFDLLILADLVFNHTEHAKLLSTVRLTLRHSLSAKALVFFTPYRPWLYEKDMAFFDLAREGGFKVEPVLQHTLEEVMFPEDRGDELLRRTVFGYEMQWEV